MLLTAQRDAQLENVRLISDQLLGLLDGMDYCLDWKPEPDAWSARQVIYHLLDTPPGGIHLVVRGILSGDIEEFEIFADRDNMTPERMVYDMDQIGEDIRQFFSRMEEALALADDDSMGKSALAHLRSRGADEVRTVLQVLERPFDAHWREHLTQLQELRDALGM